MISLKKIQANMIFPSNLLKRWSFQKGLRRHMIFLVLSGKMVFFFPKTLYFFPGQKVRGSPSQEIHGNMTFSVYTYGCYKRSATPLCQKKSKMVLSRKNTPKGDWRFRLTSWHPCSSNPPYFHGDLYRCFHALLSSEEKQET